MNSPPSTLMMSPLMNSVPVAGQGEDRVRDVLRRRHPAGRVPLHRDVDHGLRLGDLEQRRGDGDARPDAVRRRARSRAARAPSPAGGRAIRARPWPTRRRRTTARRGSSPRTSSRRSSSPAPGSRRATGPGPSRRGCSPSRPGSSPSSCGRRRPWGPRLRNGTSEPNASECITTRTYGSRPSARDRSNRSPSVASAAARFSSSAAFMLMYSASEPAASIAALTSSTWASAARKSRWMPAIL